MAVQTKRIQQKQVTTKQNTQPWTNQDYGETLENLNSFLNTQSLFGPVPFMLDGYDKNKFNENLNSNRVKNDTRSVYTHLKNLYDKKLLWRHPTTGQWNFGVYTPTKKVTSNDSNKVMVKDINVLGVNLPTKADEPTILGAIKFNLSKWLSDQWEQEKQFWREGTENLTSTIKPIIKGVSTGVVATGRALRTDIEVGEDRKYAARLFNQNPALVKRYGKITGIITPQQLKILEKYYGVKNWSETYKNIRDKKEVEELQRYQEYKQKNKGLLTGVTYDKLNDEKEIIKKIRQNPTGDYSGNSLWGLPVRIVSNIGLNMLSSIYGVVENASIGLLGLDPKKNPFLQGTLLFEEAKSLLNKGEQEHEVYNKLYHKKDSFGRNLGKVIEGGLQMGTELALYAMMGNVLGISGDVAVLGGMTVGSATEQLRAKRDQLAVIAKKYIKNGKFVVPKGEQGMAVKEAFDLWNNRDDIVGATIIAEAMQILGFKTLGGGNAYKVLEYLTKKLGAKKASALLAKNFTNLGLKNGLTNSLKQSVESGLDFGVINAASTMSSQLVEHSAFDKELNFKEVGKNALRGLVEGGVLGGITSIPQIMYNYKNEKFSDLNEWSKKWFNLNNEIDHTLSPEEIIKMNPNNGKTQELVNHIREVLKTRGDVKDIPELEDHIVSMIVQSKILGEHAKGELDPILENLYNESRERFDSFDKPTKDRALQLKAQIDKILQNDIGQGALTDDAQASRVNKLLGIINDIAHGRGLDEHGNKRKARSVTKADEEVIALAIIDYFKRTGKTMVEKMSNADDIDSIHKICNIVLGKSEDFHKADNDTDYKYKKALSGEEGYNERVEKEVPEEPIDPEQSAEMITADPENAEQHMESLSKTVGEAKDASQDTEEQSIDEPEYQGVSDTVIADYLTKSATTTGEAQEFVNKHDLALFRINKKLRENGMQEGTQSSYVDKEAGIKMLIGYYDGVYSIDINGQKFQTRTFGEAIQQTHEELARLYNESQTVLDTQPEETIALIEEKDHNKPEPKAGEQEIEPQYFTAVNDHGVEETHEDRVTYNDMATGDPYWYDTEGVRHEGEAPDEVVINKAKGIVTEDEKSISEEVVTPKYFEGNSGETVEDRTSVLDMNTGDPYWIDHDGTRHIGEIPLSIQNEKLAGISVPLERDINNVRSRVNSTLSDPTNQSGNWTTHSTPTPRQFKEFHVVNSIMTPDGKRISDEDFKGGEITMSNNWQELIPKYPSEDIQWDIHRATAIAHLPTKEERIREINRWKKEDRPTYDRMTSFFPMVYNSPAGQFYISDAFSHASDRNVKQKSKMVEQFLTTGKPLTGFNVTRQFANTDTGPFRTDYGKADRKVLDTLSVGKSKDWGGLTLVDKPSGMNFFFKGAKIGKDRAVPISKALWLAMTQGKDVMVDKKLAKEIAPDLNIHGKPRPVGDILDLFLKPAKPIDYNDKSKQNLAGKYLFYDLDGKKMVFVDEGGKYHRLDFSNGREPAEEIPALIDVVANRDIHLDEKRWDSKDKLLPLTMGDFSIKPGQTYRDAMIDSGSLGTTVKSLANPTRDGSLKFENKGKETKAEEIAEIMTKDGGGTVSAPKKEIRAKAPEEAPVELQTPITRDEFIIPEVEEVANLVTHDIQQSINPIKTIKLQTDYDDIVKSIANTVRNQMVGERDLSDDTGIQKLDTAINKLLKEEIFVFEGKMGDASDDQKLWLDRAINIRKDLLNDENLVPDVMEYIKTKAGLKPFMDDLFNDESFSASYNFIDGSDGVNPYSRASERLTAVIDNIPSGISDLTTFNSFYDSNSVKSTLMTQFGGMFNTIDEMKTMFESAALESNSSGLSNAFWQRVKDDPELLASTFSLLSKEKVNFINIYQFHSEDGMKVSEPGMGVRRKTLKDKWDQSASNLESVENIQKVLRDVNAGYRSWANWTSSPDPYEAIHQTVLGGLTENHARVLEKEVGSKRTFEDYVNDLQDAVGKFGIVINKNILRNVAKAEVNRNRDLLAVYSKGGVMTELAQILALDGLLRGDRGTGLEVPIEMSGKHDSIFKELFDYARHKKRGKITDSIPSVRRLMELSVANGEEMKPLMVYGSDGKAMYSYREPSFFSQSIQNVLGNQEQLELLAANERNKGNRTLQKLLTGAKSGGLDKNNGIIVREVLKIPTRALDGTQTASSVRSCSDASLAIARFYNHLNGDHVFRQVGEKAKMMVISGIEEAPSHLDNNQFANFLLKSHGACEFKAIDTAKRVRAGFLKKIGIAGEAENIVDDTHIEHFNKLSGTEQRALIKESGMNSMNDFGMRDGYHYKYVEEKEGGAVSGWKLKLDGDGYKPRFFTPLKDTKAYNSHIEKAINVNDTPEDIKSNIRAFVSDPNVQETMAQHVADQIFNNLKKLESLGLIRINLTKNDPDGLLSIEEVRVGKYHNVALPIPDDTKFTEEQYESAKDAVEGVKVSNYAPTYAGFRKAILNSIYQELEANQLFEGDPAASGGYHNQTKRITGMVASKGVKFAPIEGFNPTYKRLHIHDIVTNHNETFEKTAQKRANKLADDIIKYRQTVPAFKKYRDMSEESIRSMCLDQAKKDVDGIKNINAADGQSYMSPSMAREMSIRLSQWSPKQEEAYRNFKKGAPISTWGDTLLSNIRKCVYWDNSTVNQLLPDGTTVPLTAGEFHKTSYAPLFDATPDSPMFKLMNWMEKNGVGVVATGSATKTFPSDKIQLFDSQGQIIEENLKDAENFVTEHKWDNLFWQVPTEHHGEEVKRIGCQAFNIMFDSAPDDVKRSMDKAITSASQATLKRANEKADPLSTIVSFGIRENASSDNVLQAQALGIPLDLLKNPNVADFVASGLSKTMETVMGNDHTFQVSPVGLQDLKVSDEHGLTEIVIGQNAIKHLFPEGCSYPTAKRLFEKAKHDNGGKVEGLIYRVPTQGKTSVLHMNIKSILPNSVGGKVYMPPEAQSRLGSDFDGDSLYSHTTRQVWTMEDPNEWELDNKLQDKFKKIQEKNGDRADFDPLAEKHKFALNHHSIYDEKTGLFFRPRKGKRFENIAKVADMGYANTKERETSTLAHTNDFLRQSFKSLDSKTSDLATTSSVDGPVREMKEMYERLLPREEKIGLGNLGIAQQVQNKQYNQGGQEAIGPYAIASKLQGLYNEIYGTDTVVPEGKTTVTIEGRNKNKYSFDSAIINEDRKLSDGIYNRFGGTIADDLLSHVSLACDNTKYTGLLRANVNNTTVGASSLLLMEGHDKAADMLIANPIVRAYSEKVNNGMNRETAMLQTLSDYMGLKPTTESNLATNVIQNLHKLDLKNKDKYLNPDWLEEQLSHYKRVVDSGKEMSKEFKKEQIGALLTYKAAENAAKRITKFILPLSKIDSEGLGRTYQEAVSTIKNLVTGEYLYEGTPFNFQSYTVANKIANKYLGQKLKNTIVMLSKIQREGGPLEYQPSYMKMYDDIIENSFSFDGKRNPKQHEELQKVMTSTYWNYGLGGTDGIQDRVLNKFKAMVDTGVLPSVYENETMRQLLENSTDKLKLNLTDIEDRDMQGRIIDGLRKMKEYAESHGGKGAMEDFIHDYTIYSYVSHGDGVAPNLLPPEWIQENDDIAQARATLATQEPDDVMNTRVLRANVLANLLGSGHSNLGLREHVISKSNLSLESEGGNLELTDGISTKTTKIMGVYRGESSTLLPDALVLDTEGVDDNEGAFVVKYGKDKAVYMEAGNNIYVKVPKSGIHEGYSIHITQTTPLEKIYDIAAAAKEKLFVDDPDYGFKRKIPVEKERTEEVVDARAVENQKNNIADKGLDTLEDNPEPIEIETPMPKGGLTKQEMNFYSETPRSYNNGKDITITNVSEEEMDELRGEPNAYVLDNKAMRSVYQELKRTKRPQDIKPIDALKLIFEKINGAEKVYLPQEGVEIKAVTARSLGNYLTQFGVKVYHEDGKAMFSPVTSYKPNIKKGEVTSEDFESVVDAFDTLSGLGDLKKFLGETMSTNPFANLLYTRWDDVESTGLKNTMVSLMSTVDLPIPPKMIIEAAMGKEAADREEKKLFKARDSEVVHDMLNEYYDDPTFVYVYKNLNAPMKVDILKKLMNCG